jgi:hypothetical protein
MLRTVQHARCGAWWAPARWHLARAVRSRAGEARGRFSPNAAPTAAGAKTARGTRSRTPRRLRQHQPSQLSLWINACDRPCTPACADAPCSPWSPVTSSSKCTRTILRVRPHRATRSTAREDISESELFSRSKPCGPMVRHSRLRAARAHAARDRASRASERVGASGRRRRSTFAECAEHSNPSPQTSRHPARPARRIRLPGAAKSKTPLAPLGG